jgi:hypothetical protein
MLLQEDVAKRGKILGLVVVGMATTRKKYVVCVLPMHLGLRDFHRL